MIPQAYTDVAEEKASGFIKKALIRDSAVIALMAPYLLYHYCAMGHWRAR